VSEEKVLNLKEAVSKYISNGDMLCIANFLHAIPFAAIHEIIRQKIMHLTVVTCSAIEEVDLLLSGGCVDKIMTSYYHRAGGIHYKRELDRALINKKIELEDYTNFTLISMLMAGALGYGFLPVMNSVKESDVYRIRTFMGENKLKTIKSPFTGTDVVVVPALNPDIAIVHVQRADRFGNCQYWGSLGATKWSALSAKKIIVTCEEIVDHEKILRSPFLTLIPGFRVSAVCEVPMAAHPSPVAGYYDADIVFRSLYFASTFSVVANVRFMKNWIYDRKDRQDYLAYYIQRFTKEPLDRLKVNQFQSDAVNLGYKQKYWGFNERIGKEFLHKFALTREEYQKKLKEFGELQL
jgi:glutaconate CoA-transferase subunit A